jgi:hypothetical protein
VTREEKIREARRLRALGWTAPAIGAELGVSDSTIRNWYLGGDCEDCGAPITYDTKSYAPFVRCPSCDRKRKEAKHGTRSRYNLGCSCDACREANRAESRARKGKTPPRHGASGYQNYGCRCQVCRDGYLVYMRSKAWEHQYAWKKKRRGTEPPRHETVTGYSVYCCRCDLCRGAYSDYQRRLRERRKSAA